MCDILVSNAANASEDVASHKMISIGPEAVDYIMVIPNVELWNASISTLERFQPVPANVVVKIMLIASLTQVLIERELPSLTRIRDIRPCFQRPGNAHIIIVNLITTTKHNMERILLVLTQDVVPKSRAAPFLFNCSNTETVTGVEEHAEGVGLGWNVKVLGFKGEKGRNGVLPSRLIVLDWHVDCKAPESPVVILVKLLAREPACSC
jgi:hypothetical protein